MKLMYQKIDSPIGNLYIGTCDNKLSIVAMDTNWDVLQNKYSEVIDMSNSILDQTQQQLDEYFAKKRKVFDIPLIFSGSDFQIQTWNALLQIPFGSVITYSKQASMINNPKAVRAVGRTNGLNPISIIVPCHRVIGKSGKLTGYAGGLHVKKFLLELEGSM